MLIVTTETITEKQTGGTGMSDVSGTKGRIELILIMRLT